MSVETVVFNWVQPDSRNEEAELVLNFGEVAAVMSWTENGVEVETVYNKWLLKQVGVIRNTIEARNIQTETVEGIFKASFKRGGTFQVNSEQEKFIWKVTTPRDYEVLDENGENWGKFSLEARPGIRTGLFETNQEKIDEPEFEVLLVLGWYLCVTEIGFREPHQKRLLDGTPHNGWTPGRSDSKF